eukprot:1273922-Rhodomonas_salina.2
MLEFFTRKIAELEERCKTYEAALHEHKVLWLAATCALRPYDAPRQLGDAGSMHVIYAALAMPCPLEQAVRERELVHTANCLCAAYAVSGTHLACHATSLRACYAVSSTDAACHATSLRACYAVSGAHLAYHAICLSACYAVSGTHLAYHATSR